MARKLPARVYQIKVSLNGIRPPIWRRFLAAPAPQQVWLLFATWWLQVNWAIALPYRFELERMPAGVRTLALTHILDLPEGDSIALDVFADSLVGEAKPVWPGQDEASAHLVLCMVIEQIVINPLIDFGILQPHYEPDEASLGERFRLLSAFERTPFGTGLLQAMRNAMEQRLL